MENRNAFTIAVAGKGEKTYTGKVRLMDLLSEEEKKERKLFAAKVNDHIRDLTYEVSYDAQISFLDITNYQAMKIYEASLRYLIAMAFNNIWPDKKIRFSYTMSRCISVSLLDGTSANTSMLIRLKHEMERLVALDLPFTRKVVPNAEAEEIYRHCGYDDKIDLLKYRPEKTVHLYECEGYVNYMYSRMVPSTGYLNNYNLILYSPSIMVQYPRSECGGTIPEFQDAPTYGRTLKESHEWAKIIGVDTVAHINREVETRHTAEFINICEARHNRQLTELGQLIEDDIDNVKLICIAGPSSSGKTTFANRLRIELLSRGIEPIRISTDDYYKSIDEIPLDEEGKKDFETIEANDVELFNQNMIDLIAGKEVTLPKYSFGTGHMEKGRTIQLGKDQPIIVEGIHALNPLLTADIPADAKFKIFISPQAQINLDDQNPLSLTDLRLIRRIVRDSQFRNSPAEETLSMWASVRNGEFKWIYKFQEGTDYVFNSFLPYELPLMKKYAQPLLSAITPDNPYYGDAERLLRMLKFFIEMPEEWIPSNSLMREFIGGSCYKDV